MCVAGFDFLNNLARFEYAKGVYPMKAFRYPLLSLLPLFIHASISQAQWVQTSGPTSGDVRSLAVMGTNLFAATYADGVFLSTNNGESWTAVNTGLTNMTVFSLAVMGSNIFAGTNGSGVFLSTNNGTSWAAINLGLSALQVTSLVFNDTNLFAGTGGGVYRTTNNGKNWSAVNTGLTDTIVNALQISGPNLYAGTYGGGVFLSTDNGTTWTVVNAGLTNTYISCFAGNGPYLFAGTWTKGVFRSTNNGTLWTPADSDLTEKGIRALTFVGADLFVGTIGGVSLSTNNGMSWVSVDSGFTQYINGMAFAAIGPNIFVATDGYGVWRRPLSELVSVKETHKEILPTSYSIQQNYPNPFNPSTTIKYTLPHATHVTLKIYDILGRVVAELVNGTQEAGYKSVQYDASGLVSGIYFYRLQAGAYVETKKLVVIR